MIKTAILIVSFGTSIKKVRECTIDAFETLVQTTYPNCDIFRAFTSKMIINKLKKTEQLNIYTVEEALLAIHKAGYEELIVQPTHIIFGTENTAMIETINTFSDKFKSVKVGNPLLYSTTDQEDLVSAITSEFSDFNCDNTAIICMGHGTEHFINPVYAALDYFFKIKGYKHIFVGTVEAFPSIDIIIEQLKISNYTKIHLIPLMFVAGDHAINDMASDEDDSWKSILTDLGYEVSYSLKGLGEYTAVQHIYMEHLKNAVSI
jgi:Cobalamin biosynthesis protein CbiK, Co2+ chelatase